MGSSSLISRHSFGRSLFILSLLFTILLSWAPVLAVNITVDDHDNNIKYFGGWRQGETCGTVCQIKPDDLTRIEGQTWKDATRDTGAAPIGFNYTFQGTDIYVFGIVYNSLRVRSTVYLTLKVDGAKVDTYFHPPRDDNTFDYRVPVFAIHNLTDTTHDIDVEMEENSHFIFDSLIYNSGTGTGPGTGTTSSGSTSSTGGFVFYSILLVSILKQNH
ncbi:hypothetical protein FS842_009833 [Serendipita sp. 407]|nr:hypothetical protein FS842_009833 [Serendipita sp. 407]